MRPRCSRYPCVNSGEYAVPRKSYRNHVRYQTPFWGVCTRVPLMDQGYASDASRYALGQTRGRQSRWGSDSVFPFPQILTHIVDLPSGSCNIEAPVTSEHRTPPGCDHRSPRVHFGLDAGWGPDGVYCESRRRGQILSRGFPFHCAL